MMRKKLKDIDGLEGLDDFLENASISIHIVSEDGIVVWANQAELDTLGYTAEEYIDHPIADFHQDDEIVDDILRRLGNHETLRNYAACLRCKDGSTRHVLINSNVYSKDGKFVHTRCFTRDITDIKNAEMNLQEHTNRLEKANKELLDFSYIASHDLKEPLRGISNYSKFLIEDYGDKIDDKGKSRLETLVHLSQRLDGFINALLDYSRVGQSEIKMGSIDLNPLIKEIIDSLRPSFGHKKVSIEVSRDFPVVICDQTLLEGIFLNLFTNAIKYTCDNEIKVKVGYEMFQGVPVFFVKDNGIGIRKNHTEIVFNMFKRLHGREKYGGGAGVGLAIVKKIVEQHDGIVWVESVFGEGSTFYFTLEAAPFTAEEFNQHKENVLAKC